MGILHILATPPGPQRHDTALTMGKDVDNPRISVCKLTDELCTSCGRTKDEIRKWKRMKRPDKKATVERAAQRLKALKKKKKKG